MRVAAIRQSRAPQQRGQAFTEFAIWVFVLLCMISGIIWFGKAYDLKLNCHMASRYLAWSHAQIPETEMDPLVLLSRVQTYYPMLENNPQYIELTQNSLSGYSISEYNPGGPSSDGLDVFQLVNGVFDEVSSINGWMVTASYAPGGILDDTLPGGTAVRSQHFVGGGTWHKKQIEGDELIRGVKLGLYAWSMTVL